MIIEYKPDVFSKIRDFSNISEKVFSESLIFSENFYNIKASDNNPGGKSESFFFLTLDGKLVIKTIKSQEKKFFLSKMLEKYLARVSNSESKIVRIFGVFRILGYNLDFVIMENIIPLRNSVVVYDIKGYSNSNRKGKNFINKDSDFVENFHKLTTKTKNSLVSVLEQDMKTLCDANVMDYSVLIGEYTVPANFDCRYLVQNTLNPLAVGIIDIFQEFNFRKTAEYKLLKFVSSEEFSCVNPQQYFNRLLKFLIKYM